MAHMVFLKFYIKPDFSEKFSFWEKRPKFLQNRIFVEAFAKKFDPLQFNLFAIKMVLDSVLYDSAETACLEKPNYSTMAYNALNQSGYSFLWQPISLQGINRYLIF